jgi:uncharacterized protein
MRELSLIILGLLAGGLSGLIGIGGGIIIIPILVFVYGFSQHQAQGTTLAMLVPPIGILAAWSYYRQGFVDIKIAVLIGLGFFAGAYAGARWAASFNSPILEKIFGAALFLISIKMMLSK